MVIGQAHSPAPGISGEKSGSVATSIVSNHRFVKENDATHPLSFLGRGCGRRAKWQYFYADQAARQFYATVLVADQAWSLPVVVRGRAGVARQGGERAGEGDTRRSERCAECRRDLHGPQGVAGSGDPVQAWFVSASGAGSVESSRRRVVFQSRLHRAFAQEL